MLWIPEGTFRKGSDDHYPEEQPAHPVSVDGFWMDRHAVSNERFRRFVEATGHVTVAETVPTADAYPGALPHVLYAGSLVFVKPPKPVALNNFGDWWAFKELMSVGDWIRELGRVFKRAQCALSIDDRVPGLCVASQKIILIDEATHRDLHRTPRQFDTMLIHELIHAHVHDDGDHGPRFAAALKAATHYYFDPADEPA